jgi:hypothetical protein
VLGEDTTGKATSSRYRPEGQWVNRTSLRAKTLLSDLAVNDVLEKPAALVAAQDPNDLLWPAGGLNISELIRK